MIRKILFIGVVTFFQFSNIGQSQTVWKKGDACKRKTVIAYDEKGIKEVQQIEIEATKFQNRVAEQLRSSTGIPFTNRFNY